MANQDYLLRMIEQFMIFISRVVFKRNAGLYEEAQAELDGIIKDLLDLDPDSVFAADRKRLHALLESEEDVDRLFILGRALEEKARIGASLGRTGEATAVLREYGLLFLIKGDRAGREKGKRQKEIESIALEMAENGNNEAVAAVIAYYEDLGRFDKAEDWLYESLSGADGRAIALGRAFYARLRDLDDEALARGNLPRSEVEEGLEYVRELERRAKGT